MLFISLKQNLVTREDARNPVIMQVCISCMLTPKLVWVLGWSRKIVKVN